MSEITKNQPRELDTRIVHRVTELMQAGELDVPKGYSPINAVKAAWLILQDTKTSRQDGERPVLEACSSLSIQNALFDMVVQGLDPVKKQCYFIPRAGKLTLMRSYFGNLAIARRDAGVTSVRANLIHDGDEFEYRIEDGRKWVTKHTQELANLDRPFIGGYAVVMSRTEVVHTEIMTLAQIKAAWEQGQRSNPARDKFPTEMALRTVINRALKRIVNSSGTEEGVLPDGTLEGESLDDVLAVSAAEEVQEVSFEDSEVSEPAVPF